MGRCALSHHSNKPITVIQLENGHPTTLRNLDGPDQYDIARSDVVVSNKISLIAIVGLMLRSLEIGPDISFPENI
jgi:hypothetical protein